MDYLLDRYAKMLDDIVLQSVGILDSIVLPNFQKAPTPPKVAEFPSFTMENIYGTENSLELLLGLGGTEAIICVT